MGVDGLIVSSGDYAVDLVAAGLVDPEAVTYSSSARGFESADFPVAGRPHIRAHPALVPGASVRVLAGGPAWEGRLLTVDDSGSPHRVECGGLYEVCQHRQDYTRVWHETDCALFEDISDVVLPASQRLDARVETEEGLLICCPNGTAYTSGQQRIVVLRLAEGRPARYPAQATDGAWKAYVSLPSGWAAYALATPDVWEIDPTSGGDALSVGTYGGPSGTWMSLTGRWCLVVRLVSSGSGTLTADAFVQLMRLDVGSTKGLRVDTVLSGIADNIAVSTKAEAIGSDLTGRVVFDGPGTRAEAMEWATSLHSAPILCGFWDESRFHVKAKPTAPDDRRRWYVLTDDDLGSPDDWQVVRDTEAQLDYVCCEYELEPDNLVESQVAAVPAPVSATGTWTTDSPGWTRSDTNVSAQDYGSGQYYWRLRSNATVRNPSMYTARGACTAGQRVIARARARCTAYPGSGSAYVNVQFFTAAGVYVSNLTIKAFGAASTTETWYEAIGTVPATAAQWWAKFEWYGVTGGASDYDLCVRDIEFRTVTPPGTLLRAYYPSDPGAGGLASVVSYRVGLLSIGRAKPAEAANAAAQCYAWYSDLRTGGARPRSLRTVDGAPVDLRQVRAWDWVSKVDDPDARPLMISRAQYENGTLTLDLGPDDAYAPPAYQHIKAPRRYTAGYTHAERMDYHTWWRMTHGGKLKGHPRTHPRWHYFEPHTHEGYYGTPTPWTGRI